MVIFVDGKPVRAAVKPTPPGASAFGTIQHESARVISRLGYQVLMYKIMSCSYGACMEDVA
jgi:hypothetical protein